MKEEKLERSKGFGRRIIIQRLEHYRDRDRELLTKWREIVSNADAINSRYVPAGEIRVEDAKPKDIRRVMGAMDNLQEGRKTIERLEKSLDQFQYALDRMRTETDKDPFELLEEITKETGDNGWIGNCRYKGFSDEEIDEAIKIMEFEEGGLKHG